MGVSVLCYTYLCMNLSFSRDLFYFVATFCLVGVSGFVIWTLYEWARLAKQANELTEEARDKMEVLEEAFDELLTQVSSVTEMVSSASSVAQSLFGLFGRRNRRTALRDDVRRLQEEIDLLERE